MKLTDYIAGILLALIYSAILATALWYMPDTADYTDTGVGCVDDCLEPMIEDEADEPGRN